MRGRILALFLLSQGVGAAVHLVREGVATGQRTETGTPTAERKRRVDMSVRGGIIDDGVEPGEV